MAYVTREQLNRAKKIDLLTYLRQVEPDELVKVSGEMYSTRTHDSLKISNGLWMQWSTGIGGRSALDYLIKIRGMSLPDAVIQINSGTVYAPSFSYACDRPAADTSKTTEFILPKGGDSNDSVIAYLTGRGIDREIVLELIERGRIYEEKRHHNVVFVGLDSDGLPRHASVRATNDTRFMHDIYASDKRYSFMLFSKTSDELHIFESAIDALSFLSLEKRSGRDWHDFSVLSLSGVSARQSAELPLPLKQFMTDHPRVRKYCLHLDNDEAGRKAARAIMSAMPPDIVCVDMPPPVGKDYNDFLNQKARSKNNEAR